MSGKGKVKPNNQVAPGPIGNTQGLIVPQTSPNASGPGNSAPPPKPTPKEEGWWKRWGSDALHTTLDVVGMIPAVGEVADGANALVYLAEGDKVSAALSAAAMLPVGGQAATAGKWGRKGVQAVEKRAAKEAAERTAKEAAEKAAKEKLEREAAERAKKEAEAVASGRSLGRGPQPYRRTARTTGAGDGRAAGRHDKMHPLIGRCVPHHLHQRRQAAAAAVGVAHAQQRIGAVQRGLGHAAQDGFVHHAASIIAGWPACLRGCRSASMLRICSGRTSPPPKPAR